MNESYRVNKIQQPCMRSVRPGQKGDGTLGSEPFLEMRCHESIVIEMWIGAHHTIDLFGLAGAERFFWIEAPISNQQTLPPKDLMNARYTACKMICGIEKDGVRVGHLCGQG